jgi:hypothetical protein
VNGEESAGGLKPSQTTACAGYLVHQFTVNDEFFGRMYQVASTHLAAALALLEAYCVSSLDSAGSELCRTSAPLIC